MADPASPASPTGGGPIFIVGPLGSGTTLLRLIVDSHDNIAIAQETSIMRAYLAHKWIPFHRHGGDWYGRLGWSEDELDVRMREFYGGMFERFAAGQGKARWGDKTPWHTWHLREISRLFPDAVFLAMVRQPGAVATSVSERFRLSFNGGVAHWVNTTTEQVQRAGELGDRLLLVRYEDVVTDSETTLREIFAWLGEPWSDRLLEHHVVHAERGTAQRVEGMTRSDVPIDPGRIAAWAEGRTDVQLGELRSTVGRLADFYGYDLSDPLALHSMAAEGSPRKRTLTGTELTARRAEFPDLATNFDRELTPWVGNQMLKPSAFGIVSGKGKRAIEAAKALPPKPKSPARRVRSRVARLVRRALPKVPPSQNADSK
jgi:hypothetical protein